MQLWLIRHGACELNAASDEERVLTPEGIHDVEKVVGQVMQVSGEAPLTLLSSPFHRAQQTAEVFGRHWGLQAEMAAWLVPLAGVSTAMEELRKRPESRIALVGHMPHLGLLLAALLWGLPPREVLVPRGAAAMLELPSWEIATAKLKHFIKPEEIA